MKNFSQSHHSFLLNHFTLIDIQFALQFILYLFDQIIFNNCKKFKLNYHKYSKIYSLLKLFKLNLFSLIIGSTSFNNLWLIIFQIFEHLSILIYYINQIGVFNIWLSNNEFYILKWVNLHNKCYI